MAIREKFNGIFKNKNDNLKTQTSNNFIFSIIIAIYNTEKYLKEAVDSVINQNFDFKRVQIILVDDGSTDNCKNICMEYINKYPDNIKYIHQKNQGQSIARNNGLKIAEGEFINFLDSDDKLEKNALKEVYHNFNEFGDAIDLITIPRHFFGIINGEMNFNHKFSPSRVVDISQEYNFPQVAVNSAFIKKCSLDFEFDSRLLISEDSLLLNKIILKKCKFGVVDSTRYLYRRREEENSTLDTKKTKKEYFNPRMEYYFKELINESIKKHGTVLKYIQYILLYDLQWLLQDNTEIGVLNENETEEFYTNIHEIFQYIDDDLIINKDTNRFLKYHMLNLKYKPADFDLIEDDDYIMNFKNKEYDKLSNHNIDILDISQKNDILHVKGYYRFYPSFKIIAYNNDNELDVKILEKEDTLSTATIISNSYSFEIDSKLSSGLNDMRFEIEIDSKRYPVFLNDKAKSDIKISKNNIEIIC